MRVLGQADEQSSADHTPRSTPTPFAFTFTFTKISTPDTTTPCSSPLQNLPAELRNNIYKYVARDQKILRLSGDEIVLPPLGSVCKQIRAEMRGVFEHKVISNLTMDIEALVVNFDFDPLSEWLDKNDQRYSLDEKRKARLLKVHVTCRPELPEGGNPRVAALRAKESLPHLLLRNVKALLHSWAPSGIMPRYERQLTGRHYYLGFIADSTWRCQDFGPFKDSSPWAIFEFRHHLDCFLTAGSIDRNLIQVLWEACRTDCSRVARDAIPHRSIIFHENLNDLLQQVEHGNHNKTSFLRWAFYINEQAVWNLEFARHFWKEAREKDRKHRLRIVGKDLNQMGYKRKQEEIVRCSKKRKVGLGSCFVVEQEYNRDGTETESGEMLREMASMHL
jgi:hypothetical protein